MLRKVFPFDAESSFENSFKIIFIAEGWLAAESALFTSACMAFTDKLLETAPFHFTRINSNWLSIYTSFTPSSNSGPAVDAPPSANRTAFDSRADTGTGLISLNQQKLNGYLAAETFTNEGSVELLGGYLHKGEPSPGKAGLLPIVLLPSLQGHAAGAEGENLPGDNDYYFAATTQDGQWQQVIIRALCKLIGLGDEYESDGIDHLEPVSEELQATLSYPNIQYFGTAPLVLTQQSKWFDLFSVTQRSLPLTIHAKTGIPAVSDNSISLAQTRTTRPGYWEGAGGYRTKVYRSSFDCLLRRKIGHPQLVVRQQPVAFCPACLHYLKTLIY